MSEPAFPVRKILLAALAAPAAYGSTIVRKSVPGLIAFAVAYAALFGFGYMTGADGSVQNFNGWLFAATWLIAMLGLVYAYTIVTVTLHRIFLLGAQSVPGNGFRSWTWRETRFMGWGIAIGLIFTLVYMPFMFLIVMPLIQDLASQDPELFTTSLLVPVYMYGAMLPMAYLMGRLSFVLPATATGMRPTLGWSWRFSKRYHWQTALVIGFATLGVNFLTDILSRLLPTWLGTLVALLLFVYMAVFGIAALSFSYGFLRDAQPDLLPPEMPVSNAAD